jgi:NMD protein affecting ribosome stability and mRNA decay
MVTFTIDLNAKCPRCGKPGTVNGGLCLACALKAMKAQRTNKSGQVKQEVKP